ncbi:MAG: lysylphosphatidylglycerol synthase transmembrane domain-containing protein [Chloroflexota bacterium]|nr:lysylphosphatidylglycerol synthase transmembrane domain-containing protein [Chloroflexota bacterium]
MKQQAKQRWQLWVGLIISGVALVLAVLGIDLHRVAETLTRAEYVYFIPATVGFLAYLLTRSIRWRLLLGPDVSLVRCFWVTNIGYLVSNVFPFRLGDPARAVVIGRDEKVSTAAALSTVVVERVLDMLMVVALLAVVTPFISGVGNALVAGLVAGGAAVAASAVLLLLAFRPDWGKAVMRRVLGWIPRLDSERWAQSLDGLFDGLAPLRSGRRGLALLVWSVVTWACVVAFYWALMRAFVPRPPALAAPFLVCVVGMGMAIPSSPGAMGVFHAVARYGLTVPFGVPTDQAATVAFAIHTFQYVLGCLLGLVGLGQESLSLGWLRMQVASVEGSEEGIE